VVVWLGQVRVREEGDYRFELDSNTGAVVNVTTADGDVLTLTLPEDGVIDGNISLPEGVANVFAFWAAPNATSAESARMIVSWEGPDTEGAEVPVKGRHWTDRAAEHPLTEGPAANEIQPGWGCRFYYYDEAIESLPNVTELLNRTANAAARLDYIDIDNHTALSEIIQDGQAAGGAVPQVHVAAYCEGLIHIKEGGAYTFQVTSDDGAMMEINGLAVVHSPGQHEPSIDSSDSLLLPAGWHQTVVTWFANDIHLDAPDNGPDADNQDYEARTGGQVFIVRYSGPDTGNSYLLSAAPPPLLRGYYALRGFGDLYGLKLANGGTVAGRYLGGGGKWSKERSPLENFDKEWYEKNKEHAWKQWRDHSHKIGDTAAKIIQPWTDHSAAAYDYAKNQRIKAIPDRVYTKPPPYDPNVVDIGGNGIPWRHQEMDNDLSGEESVIGSDYHFRPWTNTIGSVPDGYSENPARNWQLDDEVYPEFGGGHGTPPTTFGGLGGK